MNDFDERFWEKVRPSEGGCWLFTGAINQSGYGTLSRFINGKAVMKSAHRVMWEQINGAIPKGMHVLHRCDVRNCVRPSHLWLGTNAENMADKVAKGRQLCGSTLKSSKLDELAVREILSLKPSGIARARRGQTCQSKVLAQKYGVGQGAINAIWSGRAWKHVSASQS